MAALGVLFLEHVFAGLIPPEDTQAYLAGVILLGAARCTAMVFAFAPIVAFLRSVTNIVAPWDTLLLSVGLYVLLPLVAGYLTRRNLDGTHCPADDKIPSRGTRVARSLRGRRGAARGNAQAPCSDQPTYCLLAQARAALPPERDGSGSSRPLATRSDVERRRHAADRHERTPPWLIHRTSRKPIFTPLTPNGCWLRRGQRMPRALRCSTDRSFSRLMSEEAARVLT